MQSRNSSQVIVRTCITVSGFFISAQQVRAFVELDPLPWTSSRDTNHKYSFCCAELSEYRKQNRISRCVQALSPPSNSTTQTEPQPLTILNSSAIVTLRPSFPLPNMRTTQSVTGGGVAAKSMDKVSTGIAYGTSAGNTGYWFLRWLDQVSSSQWATIGVLGSLVLDFLTYLTNLYFKIREDGRKVARGE